MKSKLVRPLVSAVMEAFRSPLQFLKSRGFITVGMQAQQCQQQQAAHTAVEFWSDGAGATYGISAGLPATYDAAGYAATSLVFTSIGKPKTFPPYGRTHPLQTWPPISGPVEKGKGAADFGGGDATFGDVPADAGQVLLKAASASANRYSMKITLPDGAVHYLDVSVMSWVMSAAASGAPEERTANIQVQRDPVIVAAV